MSKERKLDLLGDALFHAIRYWILTPPHSQGFSPFQGYGVEILSREFIALVDFASTLPTHPAELFLQSSQLGSFRTSYRQTKKSIIGEAFFEDVYQALKLEQTVDVVIGMPSELRRAMSYVDHGSTIFLSTDPIDGAVSLRSWAGHPSQVLDEALLSKIWPGKSFGELATGSAPTPRAALPPGEQPAEVYGVTR